MYSYGICLWQLLTREKPYGNCNLYVVIFGVVSYNLRPEITDEVERKNEAYIRLVRKLWKPKPSERPCPREVIKKLCSIKMTKISNFTTDQSKKRWKLWVNYKSMSIDIFISFEKLYPICCKNRLFPRATRWYPFCANTARIPANCCDPRSIFRYVNWIF